MAVSLGCHWDGVCFPHADPGDPKTIEAGIRKRFAMAPPIAKPGVLQKFKAFVEGWVKKNLSPLPADTDLSVDHWLDETNYPKYRKDDLQKCNSNIHNRDDARNYKVKSFMKDEHYPEYKHCRPINGRCDEAKTLLGPWFHAIEKEVFKLPWFIKKIPARDRPRYVLERIQRVGARYLATDYTAFESLFVRALMEACEFVLYEYMTQNLPDKDWFMRKCREVLGGLNLCEFKYHIVRVFATRMSGEMNTSLGNGFSNLMIMFFLAEENGNTNVDGCAEGDDGLFVMDGPPLKDHMFTDMGLLLKMEYHDTLATASFCGMIFDTTEMINVCDPIKVLSQFGWTSAKYAKSRASVLKALLRCKALSLAHQYPGCPIVQSLAQYGLRVTRGTDIRRVMQHNTFDNYTRDKLLQAVNGDLSPIKIGINTRQIVNDKFGITPLMQLQIENYLDQLNEIVPLRLESLMSLCKEDSLTYWNRYVFDSIGELCHPAVSWSRNTKFLDPEVENGCVE